jgi:hypothetical protein
MGVHLYRAPLWARLSGNWAVILYILSWVLLIVFYRFDLLTFFGDIVKEVVGTEFFNARLAYSKFFLGDYILGLIVLLNFAAFRAASVRLGHGLVACSRLIRWAAGFTLSLYLFHRPLLLFYAALIKGPRGPAFHVAVISLTLVSVLLLGHVTEHQKDRYRRLFLRLIGAFEALVTRWFPKAPARSSSRTTRL